MRKEKESTEVELIEMSIVDEGSQLSVRFPKRVVEALDINPKTDIFVFELDKKNLELLGTLENKEVWEKKYGKQNW